MSADPLHEDPPAPVTTIGLADLRIPLAGLAGAAAVLFVALRLSAAGVLGVMPAAIVVPAAFLLAVAAVARVGAALGGSRDLARPGLLVVAVATILYLPLLGSTSLVDPWESHYGEVAREMIARGDAISPWWAQERWFFSKPVLDLWLEALGMRALGVHTAPGTVIAPGAGVFPRPEWALRLPAFLFAVTGIALLRRGVARVFGERAGVLSALVLATMPQFFLMARQATTDMPLVGALAAVLGLILTASAAGPDEEAPSCAVRAGGRVVHLRAAHLVAGGAVVLVLPQILYLVAQNLTLGPGLALHVHADAFRAGSAGNCDVPGNAPCTVQAPVSPGFPPALQAAAWALALAAVVVSCRAERKLSRVAYLGAFLFAALATMAKGPVGLVLPAAAVLAALAATGRLRRLRGVPIGSGILLVLTATLPWYLAAFVRHGASFTDELVFRHMVSRATSHLHDTNGRDDVSFRYYLWQIGYAVFGWAGIAPAALAHWPREDRRRRFGRALAFLWATLAFALFTAMPTKFHHYIFPALPAVAVLVGLLLDDLTRGFGGGAGGVRGAGAAPIVDRGAGDTGRGAIGAAAIGGAAVVLLIARDLSGPGVTGEARLINLVTYNYQRPWPESVAVGGVIAAFGAVMAGATAAIAVPRARRWAVAGLVATALAFAAWGLDGYLPRIAPHWGQRELVEAYYRARTSLADPLAAYNMNWKGENFYTGNRVAVFPACGKIQPWIEARKQAGARAVFFLTEPGRLPALRTEVGDATVIESLTGPRENNKFVLVKVSWE
jgi:4-amino-4-deoxy-L-arabinose transferase-like glycosyltransferase